MLLGFVVPWIAMSALVPSLIGRPGSTVTNYRGRPVSTGLGIVWLVWAACAFAGGFVLNSSLLAPLALAGPLALVAFAAGVVDDAYGSSDAKGFKGHLKAMLRGRLTTGGLKLVTIGSACLAAALIIESSTPWGRLAEDFAGIRWQIPVSVGSALVAGAAIALTANFMNLMDLRPGRALKAYSLMSVFGAASAVFLSSAGLYLDGVSAANQSLSFIALVIFLLGPVLAVWRYDLGEVAMLGDAGANPMGAVAGLLIVSGLPVWALIAYTVLMFGLNLASERISFSKVIEVNPVLRWLDGVGRLPAEDPAHEESQETRPHEGASPE